MLVSTAAVLLAFLTLLSLQFDRNAEQYNYRAERLKKSGPLPRVLGGYDTSHVQVGPCTGRANLPYTNHTADRGSPNVLLKCQ